MNLQITEPEKEILESIGCKVVVMEHPQMSRVIMAVVEEKKAIDYLCKVLKMFPLKKNHA